VAIIVNDSHGRAWRNGSVGVSVGSAGIAPVDDLRGRLDLFGQPLMVSTVGVVDELASAASLVMGQADEGVPAVLIRGASYPMDGEGAGRIQRDRSRDLFR
jgi:coenzyme F420-0:L-glutamate ligase/coenzyme F420-1:gamma-L-glutamate ligase